MDYNVRGAVHAATPLPGGSARLESVRHLFGTYSERTNEVESMAEHSFEETFVRNIGERREILLSPFGSQIAFRKIAGADTRISPGQPISGSLFTAARFALSSM